MKTRQMKRNRVRRIAAILAICLALPIVQGAVGAYFMSHSFTASVSPDLSGVATPTPTPTPTPTATPVPTEAPGSGLIFAYGFSLNSIDWNSAYGGNFSGGSMSVDNENHNLSFDLVFNTSGQLYGRIPANEQQLVLRFPPWLCQPETIMVPPFPWAAAELSAHPEMGKSALENISMSKGESSSDILLHFYGNTWSVPEYSADGNTVFVQYQDVVYGHQN